MAPFHNILFPFDFSEAGEAMAGEVREIACRCDAALTVLHSFNVVRDHNLAECLDPTGVHPKISVPYEPSIAILREQAQRQLTAFAKEEFPNLTCHVLMEDGDPATVIRIVAKRDNIDLIMMPTKGLGTFRRLLLRSVAAKVLHDSSCAVFTRVHECDTRCPKRSGYRRSFAPLS